MRKLMKYAKQYTWQSIICPILMVGEVVLELMLPYYMSYIIDVGIPNGDRKYIIEIGVKMVAMALGSLFCGATAARLASVASMGFGTNLRTAMYESIQKFLILEYRQVQHCFSCNANDNGRNSDTEYVYDDAANFLQSTAYVCNSTHHELQDKQNGIKYLPCGYTDNPDIPRAVRAYRRKAL